MEKCVDEEVEMLSPLKCHQSRVEQREFDIALAAAQKAPGLKSCEEVRATQVCEPGSSAANAALRALAVPAHDRSETDPLRHVI
jgi:hypothetical protein